MLGLRQLRRSIQRLRTARDKRALVASCAAPVTFPQAHSPLAAFEGLFIASLLSTIFWSALTFTIFHLHFR